jgi:hypothetical protein
MDNGVVELEETPSPSDRAKPTGEVSGMNMVVVLYPVESGDTKLTNGRPV